MADTVGEKLLPPRSKLERKPPETVETGSYWLMVTVSHGTIQAPLGTGMTAGKDRHFCFRRSRT